MPVAVPLVAVMVTVPDDTPLATPVALSMVATLIPELDQTTSATLSPGVPSPSVPVAVNACVVLVISTVPEAGDTWRDVSGVGVTVVAKGT